MFFIGIGYEAEDGINRTRNRSFGAAQADDGNGLFRVFCTRSDPKVTRMTMAKSISMMIYFVHECSDFITGRQSQRKLRRTSLFEPFCYPRSEVFDFFLQEDFGNIRDIICWINDSVNFIPDEKTFKVLNGIG